MTRGMLAGIAFAILPTAGHSQEALKVGDLIRFEDGAASCLTKQDLRTSFEKGLLRDETMRDMFAQDGSKPCMFISPAKTLRILSIEFHDPESNVGLAEVVGMSAKDQRAGVWVLTIGAVAVRKK